MKVAIQCDSPLLQRSLELFLKDDVSTIQGCDILIRDKAILDDNHLTFVVGMDIAKPFSKDQLFRALDLKYKNTKMPYQEETVVSQILHQRPVETLEQRIDLLTCEYQANILNTIREFYEQ